MDNLPFIIQIMPTRDWAALYREDDNSLFVSPLIGWGLDDSGEVIPLDTDESGTVSDPRSHQNFERLVNLTLENMNVPKET